MYIYGKNIYNILCACVYVCPVNVALGAEIVMHM